MGAYLRFGDMGGGGGSCWEWFMPLNYCFCDFGFFDAFSLAHITPLPSLVGACRCLSVQVARTLPCKMALNLALSMEAMEVDWLSEARSEAAAATAALQREMQLRTLQSDAVSKWLRSLHRSARKIRSFSA